MGAGCRVNRPVSPLARRVGLYTLAALPSSQAMGVPEVTAGALYEYALDHLEVRDRGEADRVRRVMASLDAAVAS